MTQREEPLADVLAAAPEVSRSQLHRWQQDRLLPAPRQEHLGRGLGTRTWYPPGTIDQLHALRDALASHRSLDGAAWRLWWQGFPIPESRIRPLLDDHVRGLQQRREAVLLMKSGDDDTPSELLDAWSRGRLGERFLRRVRKRTGIDQFATFVMLVNELGTDTVREALDDNLEVFAKGIGVASVRDLRGQRGQELIRALRPLFAKLASLFNPEALRRVLEPAPFSEVEAARDDLKGLLDLIEPSLTFCQRVLGRAIDSALITAEWSPESQQLAVLVWLSVRQHRPVWYEAVSAVAGALRAGEPVEGVFERFAQSEDYNG